ncbi:carbonic anhydrase 2-like [Thrips palmi]|uniref:Carbonic anhydrase n=1 Tax=Thrips palmi TaxID=161013 RepID=A0A6P8ZLW5_THRPL|nr:carbonic anhydrase 2-like [Thrips palmi]
MASRLVSVVALVLAAAACALANQSPIDIIPADAVTTTLAPLSFKHYHSSQSTYYLSNTGHGAQITLKNWLYNPRVKGGPLPKSFILEQVHFHWGSTDGKGSEHHLNGKPFSMEVHLVHWNSKYDSYEEAANQPDGLAVVGFFIEALEAYRNPDFQKLVDEIPKISAADSSKVESNANLLAWVLPSLQKGGYYSYPGSLTTEPYSENVIWIVYENPIIIGKSQIEPFRSIENHHEEALLTNFRSLQSNSDLQLKYIPA